MAQKNGGNLALVQRHIGSCCKRIRHGLGDGLVEQLVQHSLGWDKDRVCLIAAGAVGRGGVVVGVGVAEQGLQTSALHKLEKLGGILLQGLQDVLGRWGGGDNGRCCRSGGGRGDGGGGGDGSVDGSRIGGGGGGGWSGGGSINGARICGGGDVSRRCCRRRCSGGRGGGGGDGCCYLEGRRSGCGRGRARAIAAVVASAAKAVKESRRVQNARARTVPNDGIQSKFNSFVKTQE